MKRKLVVLSLVVAFDLAAGKSPEILSGTRVAANEVIVKLADTDPASIARIRELAAADSLQPIGEGGLYHLHSRNADVPTLIKRLSSDPTVVRVEANALAELRNTAEAESRKEREVVISAANAREPIRNGLTVAPLGSNDPYLSQQWTLSNFGQAIWPGSWSSSSLLTAAGSTPGKSGADIKAEQSWAVTTGSKNIVVVLLDSGISYTHPDLAPNVWSNPGGIGGCPRGTHGFTTIPGTTEPCDPVDRAPHGVYMAGIIGAAGNNGIGIAGINWAVTLLEIKVGETQESVAAVVSGIQLAVAAKKAGVNVRVISAPILFSAPSDSMREAIILAGQNDILFVAASGNDGVEIAPSGPTPVYPAAYDLPNLIAVAATDNQDRLWSGSNYGRETVHLGAPGDRTISTALNNDYGFFCCTSGATATVSGAAALILSAPGMSSISTAELKNRILANVDPIPSLANQTQTGGRLNVCAAIPGCGVSLNVTVSSSQLTLPHAGGASTVKLSSGGLFRARTDHPSWVSLSYQVSGSLTVTAAPNQTGASRTASIWIAGQTIAVSQN
jgi:hypothetical protein